MIIEGKEDLIKTLRCEDVSVFSTSTVLQLKFKDNVLEMQYAKNKSRKLRVIYALIQLIKQNLNVDFHVGKSVPPQYIISYRYRSGQLCFFSTASDTQQIEISVTLQGRRGFQDVIYRGYAGKQLPVAAAYAGYTLAVAVYPAAEQYPVLTVRLSEAEEIQQIA